MKNKIEVQVAEHVEKTNQTTKPPVPEIEWTADDEAGGMWYDNMSDDWGYVATLWLHDGEDGGMDNDHYDWPGTTIWTLYSKREDDLTKIFASIGLTDDDYLFASAGDTSDHEGATAWFCAVRNTVIGEVRDAIENWIDNQ